MSASFYVILTLSKNTSPEAREQLAILVTRLAARFSFQGLEDWSVDLKNSRVLGAETEFHDLRKAGKVKPEMRVYFAKQKDAALFVRILAAAFADLKISKPRKLAPRDWMKAWRRHYKTQAIREGKRWLAIVPSWVKAPKGADASVRISPGQAFGTGTHPTTRLCLRLLLRHGLSSPGSPRAPGAKSVLDFGAGTGVLLIAAKKLGGIGRGYAVESDPVALAQCRKNLRLNRVESLKLSRKLPRGRHDIVFANVLAPVLLAQRRALHGAIAREGLIFLSGILRTEAYEFLEKFGGKDLALVEKLEEGDWAAIAMRRL